MSIVGACPRFFNATMVTPDVVFGGLTSKDDFDMGADVWSITRSTVRENPWYVACFRVDKCDLMLTIITGHQMESYDA